MATLNSSLQIAELSLKVGNFTTEENSSMGHSIWFALLIQISRLVVSIEDTIILIKTICLN